MWIIKKLVPAIMVCLYGPVFSAAGQVFIFRDLNQELLGLVINVADRIGKVTDGKPDSFLESWSGSYAVMAEHLDGSDAVDIVRSLAEQGHTVDPEIALLYTEGFTELRAQYESPRYMTDPSSSVRNRYGKLIGSLRELYADPVITDYFSGKYQDHYRHVLENSRDLFDQTGQVLEVLEWALGIPPPDNFVNIFYIFAPPGTNRVGIMDRKDGGKTVYVLTGMELDKSTGLPVFEISPELLFNMYSYCVMENARALTPDFDRAVERLITPKVREIALEKDNIEELAYYYVLGSAQMALTAYMFLAVGNTDFRRYITEQFSDDYLYLYQLLEEIENGFPDSGLDFYEFFPLWLAAIEPVE